MVVYNETGEPNLHPFLRRGPMERMIWGNQFPVQGAVSPDLCCTSIMKLTKLTTRKTVVITGGSRGMGREVGRQLAEKGANVIIVARGEQKLQEAMEHIRASVNILRIHLSY